MNWEELFRHLRQPRAALVVGLAAFAVVLVPEAIATLLLFDAIRQRYGGFISITGILAFFVWLVEAGCSVAGRLRIRWRKRQVSSRLDKLPSAEALMLARALQEDRQTVCLELMGRVASGLRAKALLVPASAGDYEAFPHTIPNYVWDHLRENKSAFLARSRQGG